MNKLTILLSFTVSIIALISVQWRLADIASAETVKSRQMAVIVADGTAINWYPDGPNLASSFVGLISSIRGNHQLLAFIGDDDPSNILGPYEAKDPNLKVAREQIDARLTSLKPRQNDGLAKAITEAYAILGEEMAAPGSSVYVITGTSPGTQFNHVSNQLNALADKFADKGWQVNGIALPDASKAALEFVGKLSTKSGGQIFQLSISEGYKNVADSILSQGAMGSITQIANQNLTSSELLTSIISIAPGTRETTLLFFKESPKGSLRLSNPSGLQVSTSDRTSSQIIETPHVVIWKLLDPTPGNWRVDAKGMDGLISVWEHSFNKYNLILRSTNTLPLNDTNTLVAHVSDGETPVILKEVRLTMKIIGPTGITTIHDMKDNGNATDSKANDGYFSVVLPPLLVEGKYNVELELSWLGHNHHISANTSFEAKAFPQIAFQALSLTNLKPGNRIQVGTVSVHVQGSPFPVESTRLLSSLSSPEGQEGILELEPRRLFGEGPAWQYDVFFTPKEQSRHTLVLQLNIEYAGRSYSQMSNPIVLSSFIAPPQIDPVSNHTDIVSPISVLPPILPPAISIPSPTEYSTESFGSMAAVLSAVFLAAIVAISLLLLPKTRPHGYIYNDLDEPIVDFKNVKRSPILRFLLKGRVRGKELSIPGLENVTFRFSGNKVTLHKAKSKQTIRVNNQPLIDKAIIQDKAWIGTGGRLYTFLLSPQTS